MGILSVNPAFSHADPVVPTPPGHSGETLSFPQAIHAVIPAMAGIHRHQLVIPANAGIHRHQLVIPANAGIHLTPAWIPAFAGMTEWQGPGFPPSRE
jgi:hypothetical protein